MCIDCSVSGRGVLRLTVIQERFYLLTGLAVVAQLVILAGAVDFGLLGCKVVCFFVTFVSIMGMVSGTSIAVCR